MVLPADKRQRAGPKLGSRAEGVRDEERLAKASPVRDERLANLEQRGLRSRDAMSFLWNESHSRGLCPQNPLIMLNGSQEAEASYGETYPPSQQISAFNIHLSNGDLIISPERMDLFSEAYREATSNHQKEGIFRYIRSINPGQTSLF